MHVARMTGNKDKQRSEAGKADVAKVWSENLVCIYTLVSMARAYVQQKTTQNAGHGFAGRGEKGRQWGTCIWNELQVHTLSANCCLFACSLLFTLRALMPNRARTEDELRAALRAARAQASSEATRADVAVKTLAIEKAQCTCAEEKALAHAKQLEEAMQQVQRLHKQLEEGAQQQQRAEQELDEAARQVQGAERRAADAEGKLEEWACELTVLRCVHRLCWAYLRTIMLV